MKLKLFLLAVCFSFASRGQLNLEFKAGIQFPTLQGQIQTYSLINSPSQTLIKLGPFYETKIELNISPFIVITKYFDLNKSIKPFIGLGYRNFSKNISFYEPIRDANGNIQSYEQNEQSYTFMNHSLFIDAGLKFQKEIKDFNAFLVYNNRFDYSFAAKNSYYYTTEFPRIPFTRLNLSQVFGVGFEYAKPKFKPSIQFQYCFGVTNLAEKDIFNIQNSLFERSWNISFGIRI